MSYRQNLEVLTTSDAGRWREVLEEIGIYDFYHLPAFHRLAEIRDEGEAVMPVFREAGYVIAFPMLFRDIAAILSAFAREGLRDATSVTGFAGPVASTFDVPEETKQHFLQELRDFLQQEHILAVFSRLSPLMNQSSLLAGCGEIVERGVTVSIDLTVPPDVQLARYKSNYRAEIRRLERIGFTCELAGPEYLDDFIRIYSNTMNRAGAEPIYHYDRAYCEYLMYEMSDVIRLFVCKFDDTVVSVAMSALCGGIIEGLLGGTAAEHRRLSPSKFLYDEIRRWGNDVGARTFHLGGGIGARRDSLYDFKMRFGGREHIYSTWRYVVDREAYDEICREVYRYAGAEPKGSYFPRYRDPSLCLDRAALSSSM